MKVLDVHQLHALFVEFLKFPMLPEEVMIIINSFEL
jgi:hypothetical protein